MSPDGGGDGGDGGDSGDEEIVVNPLDRLDALISARMDDELTPAEGVDLDALMAAHPDQGARARAFDDLDATLRSLAHESVDEGRLDAAYERLRTRLGFDASNRPSSSPSHSPKPSRDFGLRRESIRGPVIPLILAAAAAFLLYLFVPTEPPPHLDESSFVANLPLGESDGRERFASTDTTNTVDEGIVHSRIDPEAETSAEFDLGLEEEVVLVLGYGDEMSELQGITSDDLELIEQLDLLDFLSDREGTLDVMEDRG